MPSRLVVPSKGALRALRNLALGTSCTVAFTTGVLTEDRRRRIHSAQVVHDNAKKIKSSRNYHGSGAAEAIEELTLRNGDESFWQDGRSLPASSVPKDKAEKKTIGPVDESFAQARTQWLPMEPDTRANFKYSSVHVRSPVSRTPKFPPGRAPSDYYPTPRRVRRAPRRPKATSKSFLNTPLQSEPRDTLAVTGRQLKLAFDILKLLQGGVARDCIDAAVLRFFDAFEEVIPVDDSGISQELMYAAVQLSNASIAQNNFNTAEKIIQAVLSYGKLDLETFLAFDPAAIMKGLISTQPKHNSDSTASYKANLRKACLLYLMEFKTEPKSLPRTMLYVGQTLCKEASLHGLFDLVAGLYWRVETYNDGTPLSLVNSLINATYSRGQHARVLRYFTQFYIHTSPSQLEFYNIISVVMKSIFYSSRHQECEEILVSATNMAERGGLVMSTTWYLKFLGYDWKRYRNIARTRAIFDRLRPHFHLTAHPQAIYCAIIQFCIEANDEAAAASYYGLLMQSHDLSATDVRIHCQFILAKAMRNDWSGVKENLRNIKQTDPDLTEFSDAFVPILRHFARSHDVRETEEFLRLFINQYGGILNPFLSSVMINEYLKAGEIDSVSRWMDYMDSVNCPLTSSFFNIVLRSCYHKFKLSYEEVLQLYHSVANRGIRNNRFVNGHTLFTLRHIAMSSSGKNVAEAVKRLQYLKLRVPIKRINCTDDIRESMTIALAKGDPARALKVYRRALHDQIWLSEPTVTMAVMAVFELDPDNFDAAACLLQDSQQNGQNVQHAMSSMSIQLISRLGMDRNATPESVKDLTLSSISTLDSRGISIPICVITHTMSILIRREQYQEAVDFWNSMSRREGHPSIPIDLHTLTTLLRAYVELRDPVGVEWVIKTLHADKITPDKRFQKTLVNARRAAEKFVAPYFAHSIVKALNTINEMRGGVVRERENVKKEILNIMESAILPDELESPDLFDPLEVGFNKPEMELPKFRLAASSKEARLHRKRRKRTIRRTPIFRPILALDGEPPAGSVGVAVA